MVKIEFPLTPEGVSDAASDLERIRELVERPHARPVALAKQPARLVFTRAVGARSREVLRLLPAGKAAALTPSELAKKMRAWASGEPLSRASARAAIRNIQRCESHLLAEGLVDRRILQIDFSGYDREGSGRYYLEPEDKRILDRCFAKEAR
jgi:hypothetical protein